jgi:hypothetical protein
VRFVVVVIGAGAALTFVVASGLMNWVFMTSLGKSEFERQILGAVSIAVSAFLALLPTLLVWAFRERRIAYMVLGVPVFLAFAAFSLSSAVGFAAKNRGSIGEDRALAGERLVAVRQELSQAEIKLTALGAPKPLGVVNELLRGLEQDRRWQLSKACSEATADASRAFCKGYFELKAEAALAGEAQRHEERIASLKVQARRLEEQGAGREADNQAAVLADILGLQTARVERGLMLFLAVLVEAGAALGLYFATGHLRFETSAHETPERGAMVIEGGPLKVLPQGKPHVSAKQIAAAAPRRVPRVKRVQV